MSLSTFVWLCPCISFSSMTQFPQPRGFFWYITCGSILSERRASPNWAPSKKTYVSFTQPLCQCARPWCVSFFSWRAVQQTLSVQGLEQLLDQTSSCTDQMALLPGHSSLFADLDWPNLFVCRPSSSAAWPHPIGLAGGAKVQQRQHATSLPCSARCVCVR